jgi:hypothetical protein
MKEERQQRIRQYLAKFHEQHHESQMSTVQVIEDIHRENMKRAELHSNLYSTRHLLGKDQYLEFKNDIYEHLIRQAETAKIMKE